MSTVRRDVESVEPVSGTHRIHRHSAFVRITHWVNAISFLFLIPSGIAILIAHPELYLGETGYFGDPAVIVIPVEQNVDHTGWGRGMHFFFAWTLVVNGLVYLLGGLASGHIRDEMLPTGDEMRRRGRSTMALGGPKAAVTLRYNVVQKIVYLLVMFVLLPMMLFTGLAMAPAVVAAFPDLFGLLGGRQTARTLHFVVAVLLVAFFAIHILMLLLSDPANRLRSIITGRLTADREEE